MSVTDGGEDHETANETRSRRRTRMAVGATALAVLLGGGAYLITDQVTKNSGETTEIAALASPEASVSPGAPSPSGSSFVSSATPQTSATPSGSGQSISPEVRESIEAARDKMLKDGVPVKHPVVPKVAQTVGNVEITTTGSLKEGGIVRIEAARANLSGQRELAYVAGGVKEYRKVPCSQTFQFSTNPTPAKKANLLMCWRTTPQKSVVAIIVDPKGKPSRDKAVDALEKKWRTMGK